jgi:endoglucanase
MNHWPYPHRTVVLFTLILLCVACTQPTAAPPEDSDAPENADTLDASYVKGSGYARALQLNFYFFEAQQSGRLSATNRVPWRGTAHLNDGKDVGRNLSGGWYDAGDLWKSNTTMAFSASMLAWSALQFPAGYDKSAQWEELRDSLKHVNDYFIRCIVDPAPSSVSSFNGYELYVDVGGTYTGAAGTEQPEPSVHSMWAAPEVTDGFTLREATKVNTEIAGPDVAAAMSAAMASSAIVFFERGEVSYARSLLQRARKLFAYADRYPFEAQERNLTVNEELPVIAPNGNVRPLGYRSSEAADEQFFAAAWLYKAELALGYGQAKADSYFNWAKTFVTNPADHPEGKNKVAGGYENLGSVFGWWSDPNVGEYSSPAALLWLMNRPDTFAVLEPFLYVPNPANEYDVGLFDSWLNNPRGEHPKTPGGLTYRIWWGDGFLVARNMHVSFMALVYSNWTSDTVRKNKLYTFAKQQMNYALGNNPLRMSYLVGYGSRWPQRPLHGAASGFWSGGENANPNFLGYQTKARHTLYGALVAGPKSDDSYPDEWTDNTRSEPIIYSNASMAGVLAALVSKEANPGIVDSVLPPPSDAQRNTNLNWVTTDREFFGEAKLVSQTSSRLEIEALINNRSRWTPRVTDKLSMRFFITLSAGTTPNDVSVRLLSSEGGRLKPLTQWSGQTYFFDLDFTGQRILPSYIYGANSRPGKANVITDFLYRRSSRLELNLAPGKSLELGSGSLTGVTATMQIRPKIAVYDAGRLVGGEEMPR